ncbi:MAG: hypothetical protein JRI79_13565 [Deltaproteobacteria bacterium]|nr:hypothetical protein [Deltaproteobacteria bacterium]MBW1978973.1 hypothetical protein [Deltaproteobacteria bacterium]MBW2044477.1 hypothetical protein [Deltaproteobacteria bacterium]
MKDYEKIMEILYPDRKPDFLTTVVTRMLSRDEPKHARNDGIDSLDVFNIDPLEELSLKRIPTNSKESWWVKFPRRALKEIRKMEAYTNAAVRCSGKKMIWEEVVKNNFGTQFYISIEAKDYPHKMPKAFVKEAEIKFKHGKHMYRDGSLCLMHPNEYNSNISILQIRNLACAWVWAVEVYTHTKQWPTAEED